MSKKEERETAELRQKGEAVEGLGEGGRETVVSWCTLDGAVVF